jgi:hypothetical protein
MTHALDRLVEHELGRLHLAGGCGCPACRGARLRHNWDADWDDERGGRDEAQPARGATRSGTGGRAMPAWRGWSMPATLGQIAQALKDFRAGKTVPINLRPFVQSGASNVYRITRAGIDRDRPLTIGMVQDTRSIAQRVGEHRSSPSRGDPMVNQAIRNLTANQVLVQAGRLVGHPDVRQTHGYEIWLQGRERPRVYEPDTRTFDESIL